MSLRKRDNNVIVLSLRTRKVAGDRRKVLGLSGPPKSSADLQVRPKGIERMSHHAQQTIKKQVRTYYGQSIRASAAGGCCTPSYGCGSPFDVADLKTGEVVLDLGSGACLDAILAARQVGVGGQVFGLDMTDEM